MKSFIISLFLVVHNLEAMWTEERMAQWSFESFLLIARCADAALTNVAF